MSKLGMPGDWQGDKIAWQKGWRYSKPGERTTSLSYYWMYVVLRYRRQYRRKELHIKPLFTRKYFRQKSS